MARVAPVPTPGDISFSRFSQLFGIAEAWGRLGPTTQAKSNITALTEKYKASLSNVSTNGSKKTDVEVVPLGKEETYLPLIVAKRMVAEVFLGSSFSRG